MKRIVILLCLSCVVVSMVAQPAQPSLARSRKEAKEITKNLQKQLEQFKAQEIERQRREAERQKTIERAVQQNQRSVQELEQIHADQFMATPPSGKGEAQRTWSATGQNTESMQQSHQRAQQRAEAMKNSKQDNGYVNPQRNILPQNRTPDNPWNPGQYAPPSYTTVIPPPTQFRKLPKGKQKGTGVNKQTGKLRGTEKPLRQMYSLNHSKYAGQNTVAQNTNAQRINAKPKYDTPQALQNKNVSPAVTIPPKGKDVEVEEQTAQAASSKKRIPDNPGGTNEMVSEDFKSLKTIEEMKKEKYIKLRDAEMIEPYIKEQSKQEKAYVFSSAMPASESLDKIIVPEGMKIRAVKSTKQKPKQTAMQDGGSAPKAYTDEDYKRWKKEQQCLQMGLQYMNNSQSECWLKGKKGMMNALVK